MAKQLSTQEQLMALASLPCNCVCHTVKPGGLMPHLGLQEACKCLGANRRFPTLSRECDKLWWRCGCFQPLLDGCGSTGHGELEIPHPNKCICLSTMRVLVENIKGDDVIMAMFNKGWQSTHATFISLALTRCFQVCFYNPNKPDVVGVAVGEDFTATVVEAAGKALEKERQKP